MLKLITKSQQAVNYIRNAIAGGRWAAGEALPAERQLMEELGISRTTLRDALNALATEGILTRRHGSGTYVSRVPSANTIAIVCNYKSLTSTMGYFYRKMSERFSELINAAGYRMVTIVGHGDTTPEFINSVNLFDDNVLNEVVGIINLAAVLLDPLEDRLSELGIHVVSIDQAVPTSRNCVVMDFARMTSLAVEALKVYGHEDFVLMEAEYTEKMLKERKHKEMYRLQNEAVNGRLDRIVRMKPSLTFDDAYRAFKEWWAKLDRPNAVFFYDDAICDVACRAILELGIKVPEELAIVTDLNVGRDIQFPVPLTGVGWDPVALVDEAWKMLSTLISGEALESNVVNVPPIIREGRSLGESDNQTLLYDRARNAVADAR